MPTEHYESNVLVFSYALVGGVIFKWIETDASIQQKEQERIQHERCVYQVKAFLIWHKY